MSKYINNKKIVVTAGPTYLDIDAYACIVAMAELLQLKGENVFAYSSAPFNYSISNMLADGCQIISQLPTDFIKEDASYIIVDVSDPEFLKDSVPLNNVIGIYDHHVGAEEYWKNRIGDNSHIEFIGAAATLIFREWQISRLIDKMKGSTALLLIAAILDNTLNLTSANTTAADINAFNELCEKENINKDWCEAYFSDVQKSVEDDLKNAVFNDIKIIRNNDVLPNRIAQLCVWDSSNILNKLSDIRRWFAVSADSWMLNLIDIKHRCSYFVCDSICHQKKLEKVFNIHFESGVAKTEASYLRKEIIKISLNAEEIQ